MSMRDAAVNKSQYGKVAVLLGGTSAEREISLKSGDAVYQALIAQGVDAHKVDVGSDVIQQLSAGDYHCVFNMLHGRVGEDGVIQGTLELLGLPYTGSGVMASAIGMDKLKTKEIWLANNLPTPAFSIVEQVEWQSAGQENICRTINRTLGLPLIVKPLKEGSSIGMTKVVNSDELAPAIESAMKYDQKILIEKWITGKEYTAAVLDEECLPIIRLETDNTFYDYQAKYFSDATQYHCPCGLSDADESQFKKMIKQAFDAVDATGWGRVDFMVDEAGNPYLIEINTLPGMTNHSLVPMAAKQAGYNFEQLVLKILDAGLK